MSQKRHSVDQIISKLRRADVELGKGRKVPEVCKLMGIAELSRILVYGSALEALPLLQTGTDTESSRGNGTPVAFCRASANSVAV